MKSMNRIILVISSILLIACSTTPLSIKLQPTLPQIQADASPISQRIWQISSQDYRIAQYLIAITKGDDAAILVGDSQNTRLTVEKTLQQHWLNNGLEFTLQSSNVINIQIIELLAKIKQNSLSYDIDSNVVIKVNLATQGNSFSKVFKSHATKEAPFTASIEKTGQQLNTQLSELLNEIAKDPELNTKFQQL